MRAEIIYAQLEVMSMGFLGITNREHEYEIEQLIAKHSKIIKRYDRDVSELRTLLDRKENHIKILRSFISCKN